MSAKVKTRISRKEDEVSMYLNLFSGIFFLLISSFVFAKEQNDTGKLSIIKPGRETVDNLASVKVEKLGVTASSAKGWTCYIPFNKIVEAQTPKNCKGAIDKDLRALEEEYREMFANGKKPHISCTYDSKLNLIGFSFVGNTTIRGEPVLLHRGLALDMEGYRKDFPEEEDEDSVGEEALNALGKGLMKVFFHY